MGVRDAQRDATRARLVEAGVQLLVERGYTGTTTVAVQQAAGVSRGALLHHFPTADALLGAVIRHLLELHEAAAREALAQLPATDDGADDVDRALAALHAVVRRPAFLAQLGLWTAARTDPDLARIVVREERRAGHDLARVIDEAFGPRATAHPRYPVVARLTVQVLRGLALTEALHGDPGTARAALEDWTRIVRQLLDTQEEPA